MITKFQFNNKKEDYEMIDLLISRQYFLIYFKYKDGINRLINYIT